MRFSTQLIHAGEPRPRIGGAVTVPVFQSSTFELSNVSGYHDVKYARLSNTFELAINAPSLGGPETLVTRLAITSHRGLSSEERARSGVSDDLVRVSVGLEALEDLIDDFEQALGPRQNTTS